MKNVWILMTHWDGAGMQTEKIFDSFAAASLAARKIIETVDIEGIHIEREFHNGDTEEILECYAPWSFAKHTGTIYVKKFPVWH